MRNAEDDLILPRDARWSGLRTLSFVYGVLQLLLALGRAAR